MGRAGTRVGINSVACDPMRPHLFATGGSDPLGEARGGILTVEMTEFKSGGWTPYIFPHQVIFNACIMSPALSMYELYCLSRFPVRVFDIRMLRPSHTGSTGGRWLYCLAPTHLRDCHMAPPSVWGVMARPKTISGIAFTHRLQRLSSKTYLLDLHSNPLTDPSLPSHLSFSSANAAGMSSSRATRARRFIHSAARGTHVLSTCCSNMGAKAPLGAGQRSHYRQGVRGSASPFLFAAGPIPFPRQTGSRGRSARKEAVRLIRTRMAHRGPRAPPLPGRP